MNIGRLMAVDFMTGDVRKEKRGDGFCRSQFQDLIQRAKIIVELCAVRLQSSTRSFSSAFAAVATTVDAARPAE
jgi:hypothetical protein